MKKTPKTPAPAPAPSTTGTAPGRAAQRPAQEPPNHARRRAERAAGLPPPARRAKGHKAAQSVSRLRPPINGASSKGWSAGRGFQLAQKIVISSVPGRRAEAHRPHQQLTKKDRTEHTPRTLPGCVGCPCGAPPQRQTRASTGASPWRSPVTRTGAFR